MSRRTLTIEDFWTRTEWHGDCLEWTGARLPGGYGTFGKHGLAHRIAYEAVVGPIPEGLQIDHLCRNRSCVNPDHLEVVSMAMNILRGESPPARFARRDTCKNGHPYATDLEGVTWYVAHHKGTTYRRCRPCDAAITRARNARKREMV